MQRRNVICLVVDRLHAGYLGAYGNTWINTPALDRLAAQSFVCDGAIIDSADLASVYRSLWLGRHACCLPDSVTQRETLPAIFAREGWQTTLFTDDATVAQHPLAAGFEEKIWLKPAQDLQGSGDEIPISVSAEETDAAKFFAAVVEELTSTSEPYLAWIHTGTLGRVWDAPIAFREQFTDEDDPEPGDWANVPQCVLPEEFDPDELLPITHAYAGQVALLDELIDSFLETVSRTSGADETLFLLFSPRGFPLGEHRRVGECDGALYAELTHVPLMIRIPGQGGSNRSRALVQPADLSATILDCCGLRFGDGNATVGGRSFLPIIRGELTSAFDRACVVAPEQQVFVTPAWSLRLSTEATGNKEGREGGAAAKAADEIIELFVKPDDWVEINNVADRCPEIVEEMRVALGAFIDASRSDKPAVLAALPDELMHFE